MSTPASCCRPTCPTRTPRSSTSAPGRPRVTRAAAARSRSASSRAPTWRWSRSTPSCTAGRRRRTRPRPTSTPATSALLDSALRPEWAGAVRVGLASHNLFDVAWALVLRDALDRPERIEIEMLEGMAPAQARAVHDAAGGLLLYAPGRRAATTSTRASPTSSRRLDENTAPENFLRALFTLQPGSAEFVEQADRFRASVARARRRRDQRATGVGAADRTGADRRSPTSPTRTSPTAVASTRRWSPRDPRRLRRRSPSSTSTTIDAVVAARRRRSRRWARHRPPSDGATARPVADVDGRASAATTLAVMARRGRQDDPRGRPGGQRGHRLRPLLRHASAPSCSTTSRPTACTSVHAAWSLVVAPWNFPYAIPAGGVLAALAAGNAVILKPAPETRRDRRGRSSNQLLGGGVPARRRCSSSPATTTRSAGTSSPTPTSTRSCSPGSYDTAQLFLDWKPAMRLLAETSGKNALVITAAADIDAALRDLVRSAFGHAGQKCSAASLAIVEASVYDDPTFRQRLRRRGARAWRSAGRATRRRSMGPLINPPSGPAAAGADDARRRRVVARRAAAGSTRRQRSAVVARRQGSACGPGRGSTAPSASVRCSA